MLLRLLRIHHWTKNLLVFVPLLMGHQWHDVHRVGLAAMAFVAFCFASSATYIFNDTIDLSSDRAHRSKRLRPLAAGDVTQTVATPRSSHGSLQPGHSCIKHERWTRGDLWRRSTS